jgi:hypothetical protein
MQEKSSTASKKFKRPTMDNACNYIWKHDDVVVTIGVCLAVMALFQLVCVISMSL